MSSYRSFSPQVLPIITFIFIFGFLSRSQTTVILDAVQDTYVRSNALTSNFGTNTAMSTATGNYLVNRQRYQFFSRSFLAFDLSGIPSNAIIESATMKIKRSSSFTGSNPFLVRRLTSTWYEDSVTFTDQPDISTIGYDEYTSYIFSNDTLLFDLTNLTQRLVYGSVPNLGWSLQVNDETLDIYTGCSFYSSESAYTPVLEVKWYYPLQVVNAIIEHESDNSISDGSISPQLSGGASSSYTYEWTNSSGTVIGTDSTISGLNYGWYGLHVTGEHGEELYEAFLVGHYCGTATIDFQSNNNFTDNASLLESTDTASTYSITNYPNSTLFYTSDIFDGRGAGGYYSFRKSLMKFNIWLDKEYTIDSADLYLSGYSHLNSGNNNAQLQLVEEWDKSLVTWSSSPDTVTSTLITVPATSTADQDMIIDILSYAKAWQENNSNNNGFEFTLPEFLHNADIKQSYYSPATPSSSYRPRIRFKLTLPMPEAVAYTSWDTDSETGSITVDVSPVCNQPGPFHYLIGTDSIGDLGEVYHYLKDTVGLIVDSVQFYTGSDSSFVHEFSDLRAGRYYIAVFNSSGERLFDHSFDVQDSFEFDNQQNITVSEEIIKADQRKDGTGELKLYVNNIELEEGKELRLSFHKSDKAYLGIAEDSIAINSETDLLFGFYLDSLRLHTVVSGIIDTTSVNYVPGEDLFFRIEGNSVFFYHKEVLLKTVKIPVEKYIYKVGLGLSKDMEMGLTYKGFSKKGKRFEIKSTKIGSCESSSGVIEVDITFPIGFYQLDNVYVKLGNTIINPTSSFGMNYFFQNLIPGEYVVYIYYTTGIGAGAVSHLYNELVVVESSMDWSSFYETEYVVADESIIRTVPSTSSYYLAAAKDNHDIHPTDVSKVYFNLKFNSSWGRGAINWSDQVYTAGNIDEGILFLRFNGGINYAITYVGGTFNSYTTLLPYFMRFRSDYDSQNQVVSLHQGLGSFWIPVTSYSNSTADHFNAFPGNSGYGFKNMKTNMPCKPPTVYAKLERELTGVKYRVYLNKLYFYYQEEYNPQTSGLNYRIYSSTNHVTPVQDGTTVVVSRDHGDKRYELQLNGTLGSGTYILEVENDKHELFYLRFVK